MTATFRTFDEALAVALADIRARFPGADTSAGSVFYHLACIYVAQRQAASGYAKGRYNAMHPLTATGADLNDLAAIYGLTRKVATTIPPYGIIAHATTTTAAGVWAAGMAMTTASGLSFHTSAAGAWTAIGTTTDLYIDSISTGAACNLPVGTALTITAPPAGMSATAIVNDYLPNLVPARDEESDSELQRRLADKIGGTATSGNAPAFHDWMLDDDCGRALMTLGYAPPQEAYCYPGLRAVFDVSAIPCLQWDGINKNPGAVAPYYAAIETYLASVMPVGTAFDAVQFLEQDVTVHVTLDTDEGYGRDWGAASTDSLTTHGATACTTTRIYTTTNPSAAPDNLAVGNRVVIPIGANFYPNVRTVTAIDPAFFEVSEATTDETGNPVACGLGRTVRPGGPISQVCIDAILDIFGKMTPGDTVPATRYPLVDQDHPVNITAGMIHRAILDATDRVWDVTITSGTATATAASLAAGVLVAYILTPDVADDWLRVEFTSLNT